MSIVSTNSYHFQTGTENKGDKGIFETTQDLCKIIFYFKTSKLSEHKLILVESTIKIKLSDCTFFSSSLLVRKCIEVVIIFSLITLYRIYFMLDLTF